jgi:hypothetical protein
MELNNAARAWSRIEERLMEHPFVLQRIKKALHHGVVVTVAFSTHAGPHAMSLKPALLQTAGILDALITAMEQSGRRTAMGNGHGKRIEHQPAVYPLDRDDSHPFR